MKEPKFRLVVGEKNDEYGHIIRSSAESPVAAYRQLKREKAKYGDNGWGRVEYCNNGSWEHFGSSKSYEYLQDR
jgi:hypothetical protein